MRTSTIKPLLGMFAALLMCLALMISQTANAVPNVNQITITKGTPIENTMFVVNGHHFHWRDLTEQQQQSISKYFIDVDNIEIDIQKSTELIDSQAALIEDKVTQLELLLESALDEDFNNNIRKLEDEITKISSAIPPVDQALINKIEEKALNIEKLLVMASANISK